MIAASAPIVVPRNGPLLGTWLEEYHKVTGGWAATICCDPGAYDSAKYLAALPAIASAFRVHRSMVTLIPDAEDETRCLVLIQRTSPIRGEVMWPGPDSIDGPAGTALFALYADGAPVTYEVFRPGWGCAHAAFFSTTGGGKSEALGLAFVIDRWAHYRKGHHLDGTEVAHGMVASFLIDPQQGQSFAPFLEDLAAPVAATLDEAKLMVLALHAEALRRNRYLAREAQWWDERRQKMRTGRKWWDPTVDGPIITLTIDEAHLFLGDREFAALVAAASRMWRKCGLQLRLGTHTPLLSDLGGSMALRDMLTGGFVWIGRVANGLTGQLAFNGRLPVDPRTIPANAPGTAYILTPSDPKPMLARTCWQPDWYDWIRDDQDQPIGYPASLPAVTWATFGPEFRHWVQWASRPDAEAGTWEPPKQATPAAKTPDPKCRDVVLSILTAAKAEGVEVLDMNAVMKRMRDAGLAYSIDTVRKSLKALSRPEPGSEDTRPPVAEYPGPEWGLADETAERLELVAA